MRLKEPIGLVGSGFVGGSLRQVLGDFFDVKVFDLNEVKRNVESVKELVEKTDLIFVCIPTPMKKDGTCHTGYVESVLKEISLESYNKNNNKMTCVLKSTVPPGTTKKLQSMFENLSLVFYPEFLTEANALNDFKNQNRIVLGTSDPDALEKTRSCLATVFQTCQFINTTSCEAELIKYFTNCYLATKVIFANQLRDYCDKSDINYERVYKTACLDPRITESHFMVPGPDGDWGFGGHCFPKDLNCLITEFAGVGIENTIFEKIWDLNCHYRTDRDWEKMKNRAVIEE